MLLARKELPPHLGHDVTRKVQRSGVGYVFLNCAFQTYMTMCMHEYAHTRTYTLFLQCVCASVHILHCDSYMLITSNFRSSPTNSSTLATGQGFAITFLDLQMTFELL